MVIVSSLHVVVGTSCVVGVVVDGGVWLLGSNVRLHHPRRRGKMGERGNKATVSTHPKYSQARIYTTYATLSKKAVYVDWAVEMPEQREGLVLSKTSIF